MEPLPLPSLPSSPVRFICVAVVGKLQGRRTNVAVQFYNFGEAARPQSVHRILAKIGIPVELESNDANMLYNALRSCCKRHPDRKAKLRVVRDHSFQDGEQTMLAEEVDFPSWDFNTGVGSDSIVSSVQNEQLPLPEAQTLVSVTWPIEDDDAAMTEEKSSSISDASERNEPARAVEQEIATAGGLEIILFWTKSSRSGGNLGVFPRNCGAIIHLIKSHLVCEIVH